MNIEEMSENIHHLSVATTKGVLLFKISNVVPNLKILKKKLIGFKRNYKKYQK